MPTTAPTFTIAELVYEPMCSSLDPADRALWISEAIARAAELEGEVGDLRDRADELAAAEEECEEAQEEGLHPLMTWFQDAIMNRLIPGERKIISNGSRTVPIGSMWTTGLSEQRPCNRAVSSPHFSAVHAWPNS